MFGTCIFMWIILTAEKRNEKQIEIGPTIVVSNLANLISLLLTFRLSKIVLPISNSDWSKLFFEVSVFGHTNTHLEQSGQISYE